MSNGADGLLIVDKPAGWTSHDVVARARRICGTRKVGHAGTLDPMATGVLVLGVNRATRLLTFLVGCDKTYTATIRLGESTVTDDAEGALTIATDASGVTLEAIGARALSLTGPIQQVPSSVSAIKVRGERAYHRVRQGEDVQLSARPVTVHRLDVLDVRPLGAVVDVDIEVEVSSGTYVRALARDLGAALGVGGHLTALRRTRVGRFDIVDAHDLESLASGNSAAMATQLPDATAAAGEAPGIPLVPMGEAARAQFVVHEVTADEARAIGYGQRIASARMGEPVVAAVGPGGLLVAMLDESAPLARAHVVFQPS
ncbi:tRNA pseudouridine(55) synthase TruB [Lapillicoccus sp.]|uniref:tRNA pseudouridine(55) synthase TruB n=1 Tax=Lapillicoccus sp. TaxID=1909287 RepID=UPI0039834270